MDSLLSHVDARWQLIPVEFHYRGSINGEPILGHYGSPTESPHSPSASSNLHLAYKQTSTQLPTVEQ
jgi:hypothetical protein